MSLNTWMWEVVVSMSDSSGWLCSIIYYVTHRLLLTSATSSMKWANNDNWSIELL